MNKDYAYRISSNASLPQTFFYVSNLVCEKVFQGSIKMDRCDTKWITILGKTMIPFVFCSELLL